MFADNSASTVINDRHQWTGCALPTGAYNILFRVAHPPRNPSKMRRWRKIAVGERKVADQPKGERGRFIRNPDPRSKRIMARFTASEYAEVSEQAEAGALSLSEYCRRRILGRRVMSQTDQIMIRELRRIAGLQKHLFTSTETGKEHSADTAEILRLIKGAIIGLSER